nr:hypothetical protein [Acrocarpospora catenulata]
MPGIGSSSVDRDQDSVRCATRASGDSNNPIDAFVTDLPIVGLATHHHHAPALEFEWGSVEQGAGSGNIFGNTLYIIACRNPFAVCVTQPGIYEIDGEGCDIDSYPPTAEFLRGINGCTASAEGIENEIPLIATRLQNPFQQR